MLCFLSGERGSGKNTLIEALADNAKIINGRLGGSYDSLLATAPNVSAANTIDGFRIKAFYLLQFYVMVVSVILMLKKLQVS